jgi:heme exporter protein C
MLLSRKLLVQSIIRDLENKAWYRHCSPEAFYPIAGTLIPWLFAAALMACCAGLYLGFFIVPVDAHQGEVARVVFIHVPASWASMLLYLFTAAFALIGLAFNARLASMAAMALAPTGLLFAFLDIWTGCLWDKAVWGNWWQWDLSTFSELGLVLFYMGFIGLHAAIEELERANKAAALLLLVGALSVVMDFASVQTWTAQHQGTRGAIGALHMSTVELATLLAMSLAFITYAGAAALLRLRCVILESERQSMWVAPQRGSSAP